MINVRLDFLEFVSELKNDFFRLHVPSCIWRKRQAGNRGT